jgi:hypothetical protein
MDPEVTMTTPLSIFLDTVMTTEDVRLVVQRVVGCDFHTQRLDVGVIYTATVLDIAMTLLDKHGLEDDRGIRFTAYSHQVVLTALETGRRTQGFDVAYESIALFLAARLAKALDCRTIVVANLQREFAAF